MRPPLQALALQRHGARSVYTVLSLLIAPGETTILTHREIATVGNMSPGTVPEALRDLALAGLIELGSMQPGRRETEITLADLPPAPSAAELLARVRGQEQEDGQEERSNADRDQMLIAHQHRDHELIARSEASKRRDQFVIKNGCKEDHVLVQEEEEKRERSDFSQPDQSATIAALLALGCHTEGFALRIIERQADDDWVPQLERELALCSAYGKGPGHVWQVWSRGRRCGWKERSSNDHPRPMEPKPSRKRRVPQPAPGAGSECPQFSTVLPEW